MEREHALVTPFQQQLAELAAEADRRQKMHVADALSTALVRYASTSGSIPAKLKQICTKIQHCGDYGKCFWNAEEQSVWWMCADSDGGPDTTDLDDIEDMFYAVPGVDTVSVESESRPYPMTGWVEIKY